MRHIVYIIILCICANPAISQHQWAFGAKSNSITGYDNDAQTYFNAVAATGASLTTTEKNAWNAFVLTGKSDGWYSNLSGGFAYPILGGTSSSVVINAISPGTFNGTLNGTVTVTSLHMVGNGSTGYMNTGWNPTNNDADNYATLGCYIRNNVSAGTTVAMGALSNTSRYFQIYPNLGATCYIQVNTDNSILENFVNSNTIGFFCGGRTAATTTYAGKNGVTPSAATAAARVNNNVYIMAQNNGGSAAFFSTYQIAFAFVAPSAMTTTQVGQFYTALSTFLTAVGK